MASLSPPQNFEVDGAQGVEIDIRRTRDGRLVVLHDATLARTADLTQLQPPSDPPPGVVIDELLHRPVAELDWATIKEIDIGCGAPRRPCALAAPSFGCCEHVSI